ncbi:MAG: SIS domain-containing protein [Saprospiraceae bacterium]
MKNKRKIKSIACQTIHIETDAIRALGEGIDDDFVRCVNALFESKGRVVVTGIGKSAIVAKKVVATFNSTGTPSVFMHAADAIHGDLGIIQTEDIVLCISKSGETSEIKVLVPLLRNLGNTIIGMVARKESFLGRKADHVLVTPVDREADPNNLAPTASTTAQMVMGDVLATTLLALRGFTPADFALFHPGGSLGKQLYLRVHDISSNNAIPKVLTKSNLRETIVEMTSKRLGVAVVVNKKNKIKGIITDGDLRRMLEKQTDITKLKAADIMSKKPKTISENTLAVKALLEMREYGISQLVVVNEEEEYSGIIHLHDLVREGLI